MSTFLRLLIRCYRYCLSPMFGPACRFHPSCSQYAEEALATHGLFGGGWLAARRLCRCGPWCAGGYDPVPRRGRS